MNEDKKNIVASIIVLIVLAFLAGMIYGEIEGKKELREEIIQKILSNEMKYIKIYDNYYEIEKINESEINLSILL